MSGPSRMAPDFELEDGGHHGIGEREGERQIIKSLQPDEADEMGDQHMGAKRDP
jgi:hypothetical protein